jgi:hypothetical protein
VRPQAKKGGEANGAAQARLWPKTPAPGRREAMQLASAPYTAQGCWVDFETLTKPITSQTFAAGTYYIPNGISLVSASFLPGCVVKYGSNAYCEFTTTPALLS